MRSSRLLTHLLDSRFKFERWRWQLFPRMCVLYSKMGMRAEGISVRIDKHFEIKCQAWMRMFGTNIYILHTLWWRKERQPAHNPRSFACECVCAHRIGSTVADMVCNALRRCYCVLTKEKIVGVGWRAWMHAKHAFALALKSDFISNYILLDHYARHLCRYEISHPRINFVPK